MSALNDVPLYLIDDSLVHLAELLYHGEILALSASTRRTRVSLAK